MERNMAGTVMQDRCRNEGRMTHEELISKLGRWKVYLNECIDRGTTARRAVVSWEAEVIRVKEEIERIEKEIKENDNE